VRPSTSRPSTSWRAIYLPRSTALSANSWWSIGRRLSQPGRPAASAVHPIAFGEEVRVEPIIDVTSVRVLARYIVELTFENGETKVIDLEPLLEGPVFDPLTRDYGLFTQVRVDPEAGTVVWPNGADVSPRTLYAESKPAVPA
jgi:hypothetical protein